MSAKLISHALAGLLGLSCVAAFAGQAPEDPRFSIKHMDPSVKPGENFYNYAAGAWTRKNPVPDDKTRWGAFDQLQERNWFLIRTILEDVSEAKRPDTVARQVADFYRSAMDTKRIEALKLQPLEADFAQIANLKDAIDLIRLLADFHMRGIDVGFAREVSPDAKNSGFYALGFGQGGLGLPDRDYYLDEKFAAQKEAYAVHIARTFRLMGKPAAEAAKLADTILDMETAFARASKTRTELRDPIANYHKYQVEDVLSANPSHPLKTYLQGSGVPDLKEIIVGQPGFFDAFGDMMEQRPIEDWKAYLNFHLVRSMAPYLYSEVENENFDFYGKVLRGQEAMEPRWQRAARMIDAGIGEALGRIYVEKHFPPEARARMAQLVSDIKSVFEDRLHRLEWMTPATREKALAKFARFTNKVGHPEKFRDYSSVAIKRDDLIGNVQRAALFEARRVLARVGKPVDRTEWFMTPQTVNAYFNPFQNEIVFPAGILQPPFFDMNADDAINYGAIGVVIGHEITHGYDDQGRKFDADGNLNDWWTEADAKAFEARAKKLVDQYSAYEALPGLRLNGELTLGENIADLGGTSIAYEALQRALDRDPAKRKKIDGFTPEQRFFLALAQLWRTNTKEAELRRRVTVDPHSPGRFRAYGPHVNFQEFFDAFGIKPGDPLWRDPSLRAHIW